MGIPVFSAPRLQCDKPIYDFGSKIDAGSITHEFILKNVGDEAVRISTIKNCCGVSSTIEPMVVKPGSNAVCTSVFTTKNRHGKQEKQILIASNDRKNPYFELKIIGTLQKAIEVSPRYLRLNNLSVGGEIGQTITAVNHLDKSVVLESVESSIPGIVAEVVGGAGGATSDSKTWAVKISSTDELQAGKLRGQIQLNFSTGPVTVPILGSVEPTIKVAPKSISLSSSGNKEVERLVMLKSDQPFDVLSAGLDSADVPVKITRITDSKWKLALNLNPTDVSGMDLLVQTSCPGQTLIVIPISVR